MLKCTWRSPKTINGGTGEKKKDFRNEKKKLPKKKGFYHNFFHQILYHLGPRWKQERNVFHGCIRIQFPKWPGTHEIFQLNDLAKMWQKHGFLTLANPRLKTFFRRVCRGRLVRT